MFSKSNAPVKQSVLQHKTNIEQLMKQSVSKGLSDFKGYDFVVIDSLAKAKLTSSQFDELIGLGVGQNMVFSTLDIEKPKPANKIKFDNLSHILGTPDAGFSAILVGSQGSGKSTIAMQILKEQAEKGYKCLYVYLEGNSQSKSFKDAIHKNNMRHANIHVNYSMPNVPIRDFEKTNIIFIDRKLKNGLQSGSSMKPYEVDIVIDIDNGIAETGKNRYADIVKQTGVSGNAWSVFENKKIVKQSDDKSLTTV